MRKPFATDPYANTGPVEASDGPMNVIAPPHAPMGRSSARLKRKAAADYLGVSLSWLDKSRMTGTGPPYILIGGRVIYDQPDLDAFLAARRRTKVSG